MKITGVMLSGGESRRFGEPKAFASYKGKCFYEHALEALRNETDEVIIVSHPRLTERFSSAAGVKIIEDPVPYQGQGPLAGILSAMKHCRGDWFVVLPCDAPKITASVIEKMKGFLTLNTDAVVPIINGREQPLTAIYHYRLKETIEMLLASQQRQVKKLLESSRVKYVTEKDLLLAGDEFDNINDRGSFSKFTNGKPRIENTPKQPQT